MAERIGRHSVSERFEAKIDRRGADECWEWLASCDRKGYGQFFPGGGRPVRAHRWAYAEFVGPVPGDLHVCHKCDNPRCVNPAHLFLGTRSDNMRDMWSKKRHAPPSIRGEAHHNAKLTDAEISDIRASYRGVFGEQAALAREYGISKATMSKILKGEARCVSQ